MKKTIFAGVVLCFSLTSVFASLDTNLKYGMRGDQVSELQEFLNDKGFLNTTSTGFFGLMTLKAVKAYQVSQNLPSTGYVGPMTRTIINKELDSIVADSRAAEVAETGTSTPISNVATTTIVYVPVYTAPVENVGGVAPVQAPRSDPSTVAYTPPDMSSIVVRQVNTPYSGNFTTKDQVSFEVRAKDRQGNPIRGVEMTMTSPNGEVQKTYSGSSNEYTFTFSPKNAGTQTVTFDIPSRGMKKEYQITIDEFVPIPPTATFRPGWENDFNINTSTRRNVGGITIDQKNQRIVPKKLEYEIISNDFTKEELSLYICGSFTSSGATDYLATSCGYGNTNIAIEFFPMNKLTKTGKFQVKITKLTLIHDFDGRLEGDNQIEVDTTGFISQEITVNK